MADQAARTILIFDDDPFIRTVFGMEIESEGHVVWTVATPEDAMRCLREHDFDLLLIDYAMPDVKGLDFARALVAEGYDGAIALFTAHADLISMGGKADEFPLIDKALPMRTILQSISDAAAGRPIATSKEARMHRLESMQRKRAAAANLEAAGVAALTTYKSVAQEPLPRHLLAMLDRLKDKLQH